MDLRSGKESDRIVARLKAICNFKTTWASFAKVGQCFPLEKSPSSYFSLFCRH